jgi:hypothetical protein
MTSPFLSLSVEAYRAMATGKLSSRKSKYGNRKSGQNDSMLEKRYAERLEWLKAHPEARYRVVCVERKKRYVLIDPQEGERAVIYEADFVVTYGDGRVEVVDTKSEPTRKNRVYVIKRKLMLQRYKIRLVEITA